MKKNLTWAIIPARSGSKSIKNKNIFKIKGHPLIAYSIMIAKKSNTINKIIVSSDSKKYLKIAKKYGADILHLRSKKNSSDKATDLDVFLEFVNYAKLKLELKLPDCFALLRPTTPTRDSKIVDKAINLFNSKFKKNSGMRSVSKMSESSFKTLEINKGYLTTIFNRSTNIENANKPKEFFRETYAANGYIDIIKTEESENAHY